MSVEHDAVDDLFPVTVEFDARGLAGPVGGALLVERFVELAYSVGLLLLCRSVLGLLLLQLRTVFGLGSTVAVLGLAEPLLRLGKLLLITASAAEEGGQGTGLGRCKVLPAGSGTWAGPVAAVEPLGAVNTLQAVERNEWVGHHGIAEQLPELVDLVLDSGCAVGCELRLMGSVRLPPLAILALAFCFGGPLMSG
ncbi:hypothetical protein ACTPOK_40345 [Streptomyces inhibens]|uniref:hypothetical protein n=1 Tax=Streptomyces inhibens TaxID=2293571 RepID=UPI00402AE813